jgi:hypothetical protein
MFGSLAQTFTPRTNGTFTPVDPFLSVPRALYIPKVCDTLGTPLHGGKDSVGAIIWDTCNHKVWVRDFFNGTKYWKAASLQDLQATTDVGNKTVDTIIANGIRTPYITADSLNDPDFEFMVLPDLQYQTLTGTPPGPIADSNLVGNTFNWITANKVSTNLQAVIQVGDLTDDGNSSQFQRVDSNFDKLDNNNIRYIYVPGNHDYAGGVPTNLRTLTEYDTWMGPSRYIGKPYYGGNYLGSNANYYITFEVGRKKFLIIGLEFIPRDVTVAWAQGILDANTDRETIVVTHGLITQWGQKAQDSSIATGAYGLTGNNGTELWNTFIRKNKQIIMTINGHYVGCCGGSNVLNNTNLGEWMENRLTQTGDNGNIIHMLGYNHQSDSLGGAGRIMRLKFKPSLGRIDVSFFNARTQLDDPRSTNYSLIYPQVTLNTSVGITGYINVAQEATFDSSVKITKLPPYRVVVTGPNGILDSISAADSSKILMSQGANKPPLMDTLPNNSNAYIKNQNTAAQVASFRIQGTGVMGTQSSYQSTLGGSPISSAVTQGNGNFGFSIQRAGGNNQSGPHLSFYHNGGTNFVGTPIPTGTAWELGNINWFGVSLDSVIRRSMYIRGRVQTVGTNFIACAMRFDGFDNTGVDRTRMFIDPAGNVSIGGTTGNTYRLEVTGLGFGGDSVRFSRMAGSGDVLAGTNNVGSFKKVTLGTGLSLNGTGDTLSATNIYTFNSGLTNTSGTVRWGGTLLQDATVATTSTYSVNITGSNTGISTGNLYLFNSSTTGTSLFSETAGGYAGRLHVVTSGAGSTAIPVLSIGRGSATVANGIGSIFEFKNQTSINGFNSANSISNQLISEWVDVTDATRTSRFRITGVNSGSTSTLVTLDGDGTLTTTGKRIIKVTTSAAGTLLIGNSQSYIFTGTTTTWTLPAVASTTGVIYYIKNRGSGAITLNADSGNNEIYDTSAVNTITVNAGAAIILISDGTYFNTN